jgi:hypothetical protein
VDILIQPGRLILPRVHAGERRSLLLASLLSGSKSQYVLAVTEFEAWTAIAKDRMQWRAAVHAKDTPISTSL